MSSQNPFGDQSQHDLNANPFEQNTKNPFEHPNDSAFSLDSQDTARGLGQQPAYGASTTDAREADLRRREEELRRMEEGIRQREAALGAKENNWPPFYPVLHHNIGGLPSDHQAVTKLLFTQWLALAATLIINMLGTIFLLISGGSNGGSDMIAGIVYVPFIGVLSFVLWYRPIYLGFSRTEGKAMAFFFYVYFIFGGIHFLFSIYMAIGIPSTGSAGLINTISMFAGHHILAAIFGVLASVGWVLQAAGGGLLYKKVWDFKNNKGDITFQEATNSFKSNSIRTILLHQARMG